jgi:hypothetical protein
MTMQPIPRGGVRGLPSRSRKHQPRTPTHYGPFGSMPGPHLVDPQRRQESGRFPAVAPAGPPAADCGTASPCGGRPYGGPAGCVRAGGRDDFLTKKAAQISPSLDNGCRGNWLRTPTPISGSCSPRRTWPTSAASRAARSTGRLRGESFVRHGFATGSEFGPRSWSAGSVRRRSRLNARPGPRGRGPHEKPRAAACAPCSIRRARGRGRAR